jgi:hypothetical protein
MTTNNPDASRKEFEASIATWYEAADMRWNEITQSYDAYGTQCCWDGWQAARSSDKGEAVYQILKFGGWHDVTEERYDDFIGTKRIVFTAPQQAIPAETKYIWEYKLDGEPDNIYETEPMTNEEFRVFNIDNLIHFERGAPIAAPTAPIDNVRELAWVVVTYENSNIKYRTMDSAGIDWTDDPNEAIRFSRRDDAEMFAAGDEFSDLRIEQHKWG